VIDLDLDLDGVPVVGEAVAAVGVGLDLLLNGGDLALAALSWLLANLLSVLPLLTTVGSLGESLAFVPTLPGWVTTVALAALLTTSLLRLINR